MRPTALVRYVGGPLDGELREHRHPLGPTLSVSYSSRLGAVSELRYELRRDYYGPAHYVAVIEP